MSSEPSSPFNSQRSEGSLLHSVGDVSRGEEKRSARPVRDDISEHPERELSPEGCEQLGCCGWLYATGRSILNWILETFCCWCCAKEEAPEEVVLQSVADGVEGAEGEDRGSLTGAQIRKKCAALVTGLSQSGQYRMTKPGFIALLQARFPQISDAKADQLYSAYSQGRLVGYLQRAVDRFTEVEKVEGLIALHERRTPKLTPDEARAIWLTFNAETQADLQERVMFNGDKRPAPTDSGRFEGAKFTKQGAVTYLDDNLHDGTQGVIDRALASFVYDELEAFCKGMGIPFPFPQEED